MIINSPTGKIELKEDATGITQLAFTLDESLPETAPDGPFTKMLAEQLKAYFKQQRKDFTVPLSIHIGTPFQQKVWQALLEIPYGETRSYAEIAEAAGSPKAVRAIGQANKKNPIAIVIPCHRVIGINGKLTGYMGNSSEGIQKKSWLLALEQQA
ncbi:methylated-DNA--[protein]-cysteine S-methyltransferase [Isobaculum melis]|uniref:Methylated-DNA--protein-cysteine methyltransferase n=1 Tax=Isobaculum melis TaxID=142588 RepID=A0A1H9QQQ9_9LACT|nr:methylated-DNA--[protein]-cysteine S-methyltransferase [Isobaculum melis]SER62846.1 methylated-DNA-[protein]-cysteine S-methyltransferase [Isobaculum melis]